MDDALRLGAAMTSLQLAVGATNDVVDAEADAAVGRAKPIPLGLVGLGAARVLAVGAALGGLALAASFGWGVFGLAALGLAVGLAYDLRLRSLSLGWLAFALGLPLVPLYGWLGGAGTLPGPIAVLVAAAAPAGVGLAVANGRRDLAADRSSGRPNIALRLGRPASVVAGLGYLVALGLLGGGLAAWGGGGGGLAVVALGIGVLGIGFALPPAARAWEVQAVGLAVVAVGWLVAVREGGSL